MENVIKHLFDGTTDNLNLPKPKFILSIIGRCTNFEVDKETAKVFKNVLMKFAKISDTWFITAGLDTGVMKLVGDTAEEDLTVLGIVDKNQHVNDSYMTSLNPNHSSFIICETEKNDNSIENYLNFRLNLEHYIQKELNIPYFLIAIEGGFRTIYTITQTLRKRQAPVILVAVSKSKRLAYKTIKNYYYLIKEYWRMSRLIN